jgi:peroxiredoxin Q/BCP
MRLSFRRKERPMLNAGDAAPGFEVRDHTGAVRRLDEFRGRNVVLWFYPIADTPG